MVALERQESVVALHVGHKAGAGLVKILRVKSGPRGSFRLTQLNARLFHRRLKLKLLVTDNLLAAALLCGYRDWWPRPSRFDFCFPGRLLAAAAATSSLDTLVMAVCVLVVCRWWRECARKEWLCQ